MVVRLILLLTMTAATARAGFVDSKTGKLPEARITRHAPETDRDVVNRCSPVDLRRTLGPVRDQQDLGWCYAFTAADLMSQALRQDKTRVLGLNESGAMRDDVSAMQMAHEYQRTTGQSLNTAQSDGGVVQRALDSAFQRAQVCSESELSSAGGAAGAALAQFRNSQARRFDPGHFDMDRANRAAAEELIARACRRAIGTMHVVNVSQYQRAADPAYGGQALNDRFRRAIDTALGQGRIAGISYRNFLQGTDGLHGRHASSIVGRKMINGECQYMIRNSWGLSCEPYHEPYKSRCRAGHVWVTEKELMANVFAVDYIPKAKFSGPVSRTSSGAAPADARP